MGIVFKSFNFIEDISSSSSEKNPRKNEVRGENKLERKKADQRYVHVSKSERKLSNSC